MKVVEAPAAGGGVPGRSAWPGPGSPPAPSPEAEAALRAGTAGLTRGEVADAATCALKHRSERPRECVDAMGAALSRSTPPDPFCTFCRPRPNAPLQRMPGGSAGDSLKSQKKTPSVGAPPLFLLLLLLLLYPCHYYCCCYYCCCYYCCNAIFLSASSPAA